MLTRDQIPTLGELIRKLEAIPQTFELSGKEEDKSIRFALGRARPGNLSSYRGYYCDLAIEFETEGQTTAREFLDKLRLAVGSTVYGWKGGNYTIFTQTLVWVANRGTCGGTTISNIIDTGYEVILETSYVEGE